MATETKTGLEGVLKYRLMSGTDSVDAGSTISYCTDFSYSWDQNKKDVFDRATFAHYKPGRAMGNCSMKLLYVDETHLSAFRTAQSDQSYPHAYFELHIDGVDGTGEKALALANAGLNSTSFTQPEDDLDTVDFSFSFSTAPEELTYANRRIT